MIIVVNKLATKSRTAHLLHHSMENRNSEQDQTRSGVRRFLIPQLCLKEYTHSK